jgi:hypothetical protein
LDQQAFDRVRDSDDYAGVGDLPVSLPPMSVQTAISDTLAPLDEKIELHQRIVQTTSRLDTLLPMLLTGSVPPSLRTRAARS